MFIGGTQRSQQEREAQGYKWLWAGVRPQIGTVGTQTRQMIVTRQEDPFHPPPKLVNSLRPLVGPIPPIHNAALTRMEDPYHPRPLLRPSTVPRIGVGQGIRNEIIVGPNTNIEIPFNPNPVLFRGTVLYNVSVAISIENALIVGPVTNVEVPFNPNPVLAFVTPVETSPSIENSLIVGPVTNIEISPQPVLSFTFGPRPNIGVGPGIENSLVVGPVTNIEVPPTPNPILVSPPPVFVQPTTTISKPLIAAQEQPWHPGPVLSASVITRGQAGPFALQTVLEKPWHPRIYAASGLTPFVPKQIVPGAIITRQEIPLDHPGSKLVGSLAAAPIAITFVVPPIVSTLQQPADVQQPILNPGIDVSNLIELSAGFLGWQEPPDHPTGKLLSGVFPQVTHFPQPGIVQTKQEIPDHPGPRLWPGRYTPLLVTPQGYIVTTQQLPLDHPVSHLVGGQLQGPIFANPQGNIATKQEAPDHPVGKLSGSFIPAVVIDAVSRKILTVQELPSHPGPNLQPSLPPTVPQLLGNSVSTTQELPSHPIGKLWSSIGAVFVNPTIARVVLTCQELPDHPGSRFVPSLPSVKINPGVAHTILTTLEVPFHPGPTVGQPVPPEFVKPTTSISLYTRQELPYHPYPIFVPGLGAFGTPIIEPTRRFVQQTVPWNYTINVAAAIYTQVVPEFDYVLIVPYWPGDGPMPAVASMPSISPNQKQTMALDFGKFLPAGVALTGTPTLQLIPTYGSDSNPQSRISVGPVVGTVSGALNGTGVPNAAILWQIADALPGVEYIVEAFCNRTDGDIAEASTRFSCLAPN